MPYSGTSGRGRGGFDVGGRGRGGFDIGGRGRGGLDLRGRGRGGFDVGGRGRGGFNIGGRGRGGLDMRGRGNGAIDVRGRGRGRETGFSGRGEVNEHAEFSPYGGGRGGRGGREDIGVRGGGWQGSFGQKGSGRGRGGFGETDRGGFGGGGGGGQGSVGWGRGARGVQQGRGKGAGRGQRGRHWENVLSQAYGGHTSSAIQGTGRGTKTWSDSDTSGPGSKHGGFHGTSGGDDDSYWSDDVEWNEEPEEPGYVSQDSYHQWQPSGRRGWRGGGSGRGRGRGRGWYSQGQGGGNFSESRSGPQQSSWNQPSSSSLSWERASNEPPTLHNWSSGSVAGGGGLRELHLRSPTMRLPPRTGFDAHHHSGHPSDLHGECHSELQCAYM